MAAVGQQDLVLVSSKTEWSLTVARRKQVLKKHELPSGVWDHKLEVQIDPLGQLEFQIVSKELGYDWCLHPANWDESARTLVCDEKSCKGQEVSLSLIAGDADGKNFRIAESSSCTVVVHVEVERRDFCVWYEKLPLSMAEKLYSIPSWHPMMQASSGSSGFSKNSATQLVLPEKVARGREAQRHAVAAGDLAGLLLQMRDESMGGMRYIEGLRQLFQNDMHERTASSSLETVANEELQDFGMFLDLVEDNLTASQASEDRREYASLFSAIDRELKSVAVHSKVETDHEASSNWMMEFSPGIRPGMIFVHLPMVMYVHNSEHLYEMLARLNSDVARGLVADEEDDGEGAGGGDAGRRERLRAALDAGGRPYSWLVFAVVAALQLLTRVRGRFMNEGGREFPFISLLASTPVAKGGLAAGKTDAHSSKRTQGSKPAASLESIRNGDDEKVREEERAKQKQRWGAIYNSTMMFRGLWVPPVLDEDRARHPYSFNSFSRTLDGALSVLEFYGRVLPLARPPDWHVLLLMADHWPSSAWVTPVQFWAGSPMGEDEKELVVPPFMSFTFEQMELNSGMSDSELQQNASALLHRWSKADALKKPGADALEVLGGPSLAKLLARDLSLFERMGVSLGAPVMRGVSQGPYVTVRFIARMFPRPPMRALMMNESQLLLNFPP